MEQRSVMKSLEEYDREIAELNEQLDKLVQELNDHPDRYDDVVFVSYLDKIDRLKAQIDQLRIERMSQI